MSLNIAAVAMMDNSPTEKDGPDSARELPPEFIQLIRKSIGVGELERKLKELEATLKDQERKLKEQKSDITDLKNKGRKVSEDVNGLTDKEPDKDTKKLIYKHLENSFKELMLSRTHQEKFLQEFGVPSRDIKVQMLLEWLKNQNGPWKETIKLLSDRMRKVFGSGIAVNSGMCQDHLCSHVLESIGDDHWLRFARLCLQLSEMKIKEFLHKCEFTEEQKYQMIIQYGGRVVNALRRTEG